MRSKGRLRHGASTRVRAMTHHLVNGLLNRVPHANLLLHHTITLLGLYSSPRVGVDPFRQIVESPRNAFSVSFFFKRLVGKLQKGNDSYIALF